MRLDLSKNKNPYLPTKKSLKKLKQKIDLITFYPSKRIETYEQKLSEDLKVKKNQIILTAGTMEAMNLIIDRYKFKTAGILNPTFWGINYISLLNDVKVIKINMKDIFSYNIKEIETLIYKSDVIYLCNPNNPTTAYLEKNKLESIIKKNKEKFFIIDETMLKFDSCYKKKSLKNLINKYKNLFVIFSFSKIYGVPGLRLGIILTHIENYKILTKKRGIYLLNSLTGYYIENNNFNDDKLNNCRKKIKNNFIYLEKKLKKTYIRSIKNTNMGFILIEIRNSMLAEKLQKYLLKNNIIVKLIGDSYGNDMKNFIRISALTYIETIKLIYYMNKFEKMVKKVENRKEIKDIKSI